MQYLVKSRLPHPHQSHLSHLLPNRLVLCPLALSPLLRSRLPLPPRRRLVTPMQTW